MIYACSCIGFAGVLEASMATMQEGQTLLDRIRKVALCAGVHTRHATTSASYAIERLLQLLQDKWRRLDELWYKRWIQLQQCIQMGLVDQEAVRVWLLYTNTPILAIRRRVLARNVRLQTFQIIAGAYVFIILIRGPLRFS